MHARNGFKRKRRKNCSCCSWYRKLGRSKIRKELDRLHKRESA